MRKPDNKQNAIPELSKAAAAWLSNALDAQTLHALVVLSAADAQTIFRGFPITVSNANRKQIRKRVAAKLVRNPEFRRRFLNCPDTPWAVWTAALDGLSIPWLRQHWRSLARTPAGTALPVAMAQHPEPVLAGRGCRVLLLTGWWTRPEAHSRPAELPPAWLAMERRQVRAQLKEMRAARDTLAAELEARVEARVSQFQREALGMTEELKARRAVLARRNPGDLLARVETALEQQAQRNAGYATRQETRHQLREFRDALDAAERSVRESLLVLPEMASLQEELRQQIAAREAQLDEARDSTADRGAPTARLLARIRSALLHPDPAAELDRLDAILTTDAFPDIFGPQAASSLQRALAKQRELLQTATQRRSARRCPDPGTSTGSRSPPNLESRNRTARKDGQRTGLGLCGRLQRRQGRTAVSGSERAREYQPRSRPIPGLLPESGAGLRPHGDRVRRQRHPRYARQRSRPDRRVHEPPPGIAKRRPLPRAPTSLPEAALGTDPLAGDPRPGTPTRRRTVRERIRRRPRLLPVPQPVIRKCATRISNPGRMQLQYGFSQHRVRPGRLGPEPGPA